MNNNFYNYLKSYNIKYSKRLNVDDIKDTDGAYPGKEIFNFFFNGTRFKDYRDY